MNSNFALLNNTKKTIAYINKQLINYPKSEVVLKQNIEKNMYELIELIFSYSINDIERIKIKYLKDLIIKLSMLDFYIATSFEKRIISKKKFELMDALRNLEQKQIVMKGSSGEYLLKR